MMATLLDQLKAMTVVVADTGDFESIQRYAPRDATTNPSLILAAAGMEGYRAIVDETIRGARGMAGAEASPRQVVSLALDQLAVEFGVRILDVIPGRVSTEVDARLSYDTQATVAKARQIITLYQELGVDPDRVLIKIAATWEGIKAAEILEREGIHCNLTLMFGLHQAIACAEAGITLISPFVGRILDWYRKRTGRQDIPVDEDPGVASVTEIYQYYKKFGYKTEIMGASFRHMGQITALAGCDLLTISPALLDELQRAEGELPRALDPARADAANIERLHITKDLFEQMHAADEMATDKLKEGIDKFSEAIVELEQLLRGRLATLEG